jgi:calcineurin-like phosphoesterase family protein
MIYFLSDNHWGHDNIRGFCNRPFNDIYSMNKHMVEAWNKIIQPDDEIYYLGDFSYKLSRKAARYILRQLNGKKYFIKGNHDWVENLDNYKNSGLIEWWKYSYEFSYEYNYKTYNFSLSHYPHYPLKNQDLICLFGHQHGIYEHRGVHFHYPGGLDVGVDNIGYEPISIIKVIDFIENQKKSMNNGI